jgi:hypothetical protein
MVSPGAVVGDVHALLATAAAASERAVGVEEGFLEEVLRLLLPDPEPDLIEGVHEPDDIGLAEASAEVPGGGGIGDAYGPEGIEVDLVIAAD